MRPLIVVPVLVLIAFAGCVADEARCHGVPTPQAGMTVAYVGETAAGQRLEASYVVGDDLLAQRGDGEVVPAWIVERDGGAALLAVDQASRSLVVFDSNALPAMSLEVNDGSLVLGYPLWGLCVVVGDSWQVPYRTPLGSMNVTVDERGTHLVAVMTTAPPVSPHSSSVAEPERYLLEWRAGDVFPSRYDVQHQAGEVWATVATWTKDRSVESGGSMAGAEPVDVSLPRPVDWGTRESVLPDLSALPWPQALYSGFQRAFDESSEVMSYLEDHPDAQASFLEAVRIEEPRSMAIRWVVHLRDATAEAIEFEWVVRCFDEMADRTLYGDCVTTDGYARGHNDVSPESSPRYDVEPTDSWPPPRYPVSLDAAWESLERWQLTAEPVGVRWTAYAFAREDPFRDVGPWAQGWSFLFGSAAGDVVYESPGGPRGTGYSMNVEEMLMDGTGWTLRLPRSVLVS